MKRVGVVLIDFQTALGRLLRVQDGTDPLRGLNLNTDERSYIESLTERAGFHFSVSIQRSWCIGRAAKSAYLTLSLLSDGERRRLLEQWISSGAGSQSFYEAEADSFLDFISGQLIDPSHELTVCQFEQATLRASKGTNFYIAQDLHRLNNRDCMLGRGRYAGAVRFYAEPRRLMNSLLKHEPLPLLSHEVITMLFGPGFENLCRPASIDEGNLWDRLDGPVAMKALLSEGYQEETFITLLKGGAIEYSG